NDEWITLKEYEDLKVVLTGLKHGKYFFEVKLIPRTEQESFVLFSQRIVIHPAFWQTKWFLLLMLIGITALLFALYKWRTQRIRREAKIKQDFEKKLAQMQWQNL
ncbi:hypothetical protein V6O07_19020, partial [Arthrospira platensis SPKY2]